MDAEYTTAKRIAISTSNVSKRFYIGGVRHNTLRDAMMGVFRNPLRDTRVEMWALRDVSFEVSEGERIGIIGKNGAGKSTILKILSRITPPTSGTAVIHGRVVSLLEVGTGFHSELSGRENVFLNGAILGMRRSEIEEKFDEIVAFAEFGQFLDTPVKHYSTGMYMRLAFSVAAHLEPEVLIVDEVLAVGDSAFQMKCVNKMRDIGRSGRTIFFVSHDMTAVRRLCTRAIWLDNGQVRRDGEPNAVIEEYLASVEVFTAEAAAGMSFEKRLKAAGISHQFQTAAQREDAGEMRELLRQVYLTDVEIENTITFALGKYSDGTTTTP